MKLYGCMRSRATRPVWALLEAGLDFDHVSVIQANRVADPAAQDAPLHTASPSFLAINPQGQIPALQDGDLVLTESLAIVLHIGRRAGPDLGPRDLAEESAMVNWALVAATGVEPGAMDILYTFMEGAQGTDAGQARMAMGVEKLARTAARVEAHLAGQDWLMDGRFTVADICLAEAFRYAQGHKPALEAYPTLRAWLARCQARPAFGAMMDRRNAEAA